MLRARESPKLKCISRDPKKKSRFHIGRMLLRVPTLEAQLREHAAIATNHVAAAPIRNERNAIDLLLLGVERVQCIASAWVGRDAQLIRVAGLIGQLEDERQIQCVEHVGPAQAGPYERHACVRNGRDIVLVRQIINVADIVLGQVDAAAIEVAEECAERFGRCVGELDAARLSPIAAEHGGEHGAQGGQQRLVHGNHIAAAVRIDDVEVEVRLVCGENALDDLAGCIEFVCRAGCSFG